MRARGERLAARLRRAALARVQRRLDERWAAGEGARESGTIVDDENLTRISRPRWEVTPHFAPISSVNGPERGSKS